MCKVIYWEISVLQQSMFVCRDIYCNYVCLHIENYRIQVWLPCILEYIVPTQYSRVNGDVTLVRFYVVIVFVCREFSGVG